MSDNLVKDYLEKIGVAPSDKYIGDAVILGDEWEIYKIFNDTITYIRYELTGKIGYAFYVIIVCKKLTINLESFYYVVSYNNEVKKEWDCEQNIKDALVSNAIGIIQPFNF